MSQDTSSARDPEMLEEYDFSKGVRGRYAGRFAQGSNVVVLDPDVAQSSQIPSPLIRHCAPC